MVNREGGTSFDDADVARAYAYRPPYPDPVYDFVTSLPRRRERALDLGCGTGKIAHNLATRFRHVDAVDPSLPMLRLADNGQHANITWVHATAETAQLAPAYDLVTAGASIHWMDHAAVFPKFAGILAESGVLAVIEGDGAHNPPWQSAWKRFIHRWLERIGGEYDPEGFRRSMTSYQQWMTIAGERTFVMTFTQDIDGFIECQHSRATWSRAALGQEHIEGFDSDLRDLLLPYSTEGVISYTVRTQVVWGVPREA